MVKGGVIKIETLSGKYPLTRVSDKMAQRAFEIANEQADVMKGYAQVFVHVLTGSLRDSIRKEIVPTNSPDKKSVRVRAGGYVTNPDTGKIVDYAVHVEAKYPFMRPAWEIIQGPMETMLASMEESLSE